MRSPGAAPSDELPPRLPPSRGGRQGDVPVADAGTPDVVETAIAAGIAALADAMARAQPEELAAMAERMAVLARELEARRRARAKVVDLAERRRGR